ncbi:hypothetical protein [Roseovarius sp. 2305UL8-3]|uniref:hypothetical protein n=1 Tax=Roseovarius conchicola TaxID=3121636 RepID=UPI003529133A
MTLSISSLSLKNTVRLSCWAWTIPLLATTMVALSTSASSVSAQEGNQVSLHATYLGAPTDWCAADSGVPMILKMDGPDIVKGPPNPTRTIRENRGGKTRRVIQGEHIGSFWNDLEINPAVIGRFSAEFEICHSLWQYARANGIWKLTGVDGSPTTFGKIEDVNIYNFHIPFFRLVPGSHTAEYAKFDGRFLYTADRPVVTTTQTFAAKPDEETSQ